MRKIIWVAITCSVFMSASMQAQGIAGLSYRTFADGSGSWGASIEYGHYYGDALATFQLNYATMQYDHIFSGYYGSSQSSERR